MGVCRRRVGYVTKRRNWSAGERQHAEHAVAHHLRGATDADMATAELVLQTAIDALTRRTLVVANLLGELEAEIFQATGLRFAVLLPGPCRRGG